MRAVSFAITAFAASAVARLQGRASTCMNDKDAQQVASNFRESIANYSDQLADDAFTTDFTDYSDSVIELINSGCAGPVALGSATFDGLDAFKAGQGAQPPIPFEQLNLWHTCDTVIIRWRSAQEPEIITGNIVMEAVPSAAGSKYPFKIQTVYSEFNSGAWLVNLGVFKPSNCSAGTQPVISQDSNIVKRDGVKLPTIL